MSRIVSSIIQYSVVSTYPAMYCVGYSTEKFRVLTVPCIVWGIVPGTIQCSVVITDRAVYCVEYNTM